MELGLVRFGFRGTVLVRHPIFVEQFFHFFGNHVAIVRDGNKRDFFSGLGSGFRFGGLRRWLLFWLVAHGHSIHDRDIEKATYSKASSEDCSGNALLQFRQVTK